MQRILQSVAARRFFLTARPQSGAGFFVSPATQKLNPTGQKIDKNISKS